MCGIGGIFGPSYAGDGGALERLGAGMAEAMIHRGPDGDGVWVDAAAGLMLCHRRLAIVELSRAGAQPMQSADGRWVMSYNGELYNTEDMRRDLAPAAIAWRGTSDTEVLLEAVAAWGVDRALAATNGMFAAALWDRRDRRLHLVRDRLGIKPLFVGQAGGVTAFASELKGLAAVPGLTGRIDPAAVAGFLRFGYVPSPLSIWRDVRKVLPGEIVTVEGDGTTQRRTWWSAAEQVRAGLDDPLPGNEGTAGEQLDALLRDAVARQMVSDVPLGAFLSGGIDSSTVAALMQQAGRGPARTYSIGFGEAAFDESVHAARVADHLGTAHTTMEVSPDDALAVVPLIPDLYDEPFADSSQIPTYLISKLIRRHVTVALSGDGGDELFGGYNRYVFADGWGRSLELVPRAARAALASAARCLPPRPLDAALGWLPGLPPQPAEKLAKLAAILPLDAEEAYRRLVSLNPDVAALAPGIEPPRTVIDDPGPWTPADPVDRMQYLDTVTYLPDDILTKVDRASMAVSLEARVPLLDHRVLAFAWRLPRHRKIGGGIGKKILRDVLSRYVPPALFARSKQGFAIPLAAWLRGPLGDWAESLLSDDTLRRTGLLAPAPVRALWADHRSGRVDHAHRIWSVLMLQAWVQRWA